MLRGGLVEQNSMYQLSLLGKRTLYTSYQFQGKTPTTWRIAKIITTLTTRKRCPNISAHGILVLKSLRKTQYSQALDETTLTYYT